MAKTLRRRSPVGMAQMEDTINYVLGEFKSRSNPQNLVEWLKARQTLKEG
jgi:hypothetical protein